MAEGNETPGDEPPRKTDRDLLAERRALRAAESGDATLTRRAEAAEATVQTLETHLASLQQRLREAEEEQRGMAEQAEAAKAAVLEREAELRRVKQREYAEQQQRVEAEDRLIGSDRESRAQIDRLNRRLSASQQEARELAGRLESVQRQLAEAEQAAAAERAAARRGVRELEARLAELERRAVEIHREVDSERAARERSERLLEGMRKGHRRMELLVGELKGVVARLRAVAKREAGREEPEAADQSGAPSPKAVAGGRAAESGSREHGEAHRDEMTDALAAAVERLRARVADVDDAATGDVHGEQSTPPAETPGTEAEDGVEFLPRVLPAPTRRESWLAPAIRRIAERRDPRLAAQMVVELLSAQRLTVKRSLAYRVRIEERGGFEVRLDGEGATVERVAEPVRKGVGLLLEGPAAAFSELAAGGAGRRLPDLRIHGSRRLARRLRVARRSPVALRELAEAGIRVWPGLLLLALAEAIDLAWTAGHRFTVAFAIEGQSSGTVYVHVNDGEPIVVTRVCKEKLLGSEKPLGTAYLTERSFLCMLAGMPLPAQERIRVEGSTYPLELLIDWADRVQGFDG